MPTRLPERRSQIGLNSWLAAGMSLGFVAVALLLVTGIAQWQSAPRAKTPPGITTGIAPAAVR